MTSEAKTILKMIETVDPADTAKLNEIDARVWCWVHGDDFVEIRTAQCGTPEVRYYGDSVRGREITSDALFAIPNYRGSRNMLKVIRPLGHTIRVEGCNDKRCGDFVAELYNNTVDWSPDWIASPRLPTEELAELHAIIQAIKI
jgi:hypothetical protein